MKIDRYSKHTLIHSHIQTRACTHTDTHTDTHTHTIWGKGGGAQCVSVNILQRLVSRNTALVFHKDWFIHK